MNIYQNTDNILTSYDVSKFIHEVSDISPDDAIINNFITDDENVGIQTIFSDIPSKVATITNNGIFHNEVVFIPELPEISPDITIINNFNPYDENVGIQTVPDIIPDVSITNNVISDNTTVLPDVSADIDIINNFMCLMTKVLVSIQIKQWYPMFLLTMKLSVKMLFLEILM